MRAYNVPVDQVRPGDVILTGPSLDQCRPVSQPISTISGSRSTDFKAWDGRHVYRLDNPFIWVGR